MRQQGGVAPLLPQGSQAALDLLLELRSALGRSGLPSWDSSLPWLAEVSALYLPYISRIFPVYPTYISPISPLPWLAEVSELSALTKWSLVITPYLNYVS